MEKEKIIDKIRKLLALSTSSNVHEASLAMKKAQELLFKHKLEMKDIAEQQNGSSIVQNTFGTNNRWGAGKLKGLLGSAVARAYFCFPIWSYDGKKLIMVGKKEDVEIAHELWVWLCVELDRLAVEDYEKNGAGIKKLKHYRSFWVGAYDEISRRLYAQFAALTKASARSTALVVSSQHEIKEFVSENVGKLRNTKTHTDFDNDRGTFARGVQAGKSIPIALDKKLNSTKLLER